jgi:hypothetical protein
MPMPFPPGGEPMPMPPEQPERRGPDVRLILGISSAVIGVGGFVLLGVSQAKLGSIENDPAFVAYRDGIGSDRDACDAAAAGERVTTPGAGTPESIDKVCGNAGRYEVLSYLGLISGIAFVGAGAALIISSDSVWPAIAGDDKGDTALRLAPQIGPDYQGLTLRQRF